MAPVDISWSGWGDPARAKRLPESVVGLLRELLGVRQADAPRAASDIADLTVPAPRLSVSAREAIASAVGGAAHLRLDDESRIRHTRGKSTPDLLRIRTGEVDDAPDAVALPSSHPQVLAVLRACAEHRVAVVPFGGGTSVVGGLAPHGAGNPYGPGSFIALDLRRMDGLTALDEVSRTATLEPGLRGPEAEALLNERGFTLGHFPQSFEWATVGGFAAARSSGQASAGYGRFDEMVVSLTVATPEGTLELGRAPRSAAGPDLRQLVLGSEGAFGVITSATVRVCPLPVRKVYEGWRFASFEAGTAALRRLAQDGPLPTVLRLSDETETMVGLAKPDAVGSAGNDGKGGSDGGSSDSDGGATAGTDAPGTPDALRADGCLAITGYEGTGAEVDDRRSGAHAVLRECGGEFLGADPGTGWSHGRYSAPYLRDALLDAGAFAETLETATFWANVPALYETVRRALTDTLTAAGTPPLVMCHISHVYPSGASLYFTVVSAQGEDPVAHWAPAKRAANDAIIATGGTISHHHGVGTDHRAWYATEVGPLGVEILHAVKARLDPSGILNPGVLLEPR